MADQELVALLDTYAKAVGLTKASVLEATLDASNPPELAAMWKSAYAQVLFWPVASASAAALRLSASEGQNWLDVALSKDERTLRSVIDGYLILALPSQPQEDALEVVRELELDAKVCRKHVVWPDATPGSEWRRTLRIGVLGLPSQPSQDGPATFPPLDELGSEVLEDVRALKAAGAVRKVVQRFS